MAWRIGGAMILIVLVLAIAQRLIFGAAPAPHGAASPASYATPTPPASLARAARSPAGCQTNPRFDAATDANTASLTLAQWSVFGRPESGWQVYAPLIGHELGVACPPTSQAFAAALASWQVARHLPATGAMDEATLRAFDFAWLGRRSFVAASAHGHCPDPPPLAGLATATPAEGYLGKAVLLRPAALAAYRRMVAAAHSESPAIAADPKLLTLVSGYRDPAADAADCAAKVDCATPARAGTCSAHRTGLAMDLYLGAAPGYDPASAADPNRLYLSRAPAYLWLVANAARFGFEPYPFEPWHWEWTGEPP
ncbi:MAG TPA: D-alanyl-D-alanine carboxypeptidase family protein [Caulobacteraceae bacterium]|nr:D-alanyl-D-alanine carboxypeptidase family protein [Caulobacteraceae bacterium]